jgi:hypothetical protein
VSTRLQSQIKPAPTPGVAPAVRRVETVGAPPASQEVLRSYGKPLDAATRALVEPRLGHDFSRVRVHDDAAADRSARALGARAYAAGSHLVFASGQYAPATSEGRRLLAHELAHTAQQRDDSAVVQSMRSVSRPGDAAEREADVASESVLAGRYVALRERPPAGQVLRDTKEYETAGILLDTAKMTDWAGRSFWEEKVGAVLKITLIVPADKRLAKPEERDAVLSVLFDTHQAVKPVKSKTVRAVTIPARGSAPALSYSFTFLPPASKGKKERVEVRFEAEGAGASPVAAPAAAAGAARPSSFTVRNFPTAAKKANNFAAWSKRFPAEDAQLFSFIAGATLPAGGQIVTTSSTVGKKLHESTFSITPGSGGPNIEFVAESTPTTASPPAGFAAHDFGDLALEDPGKDKARLGKITLPAGMPADETIPVKYTVWQYFQSGTRNAEVDAIIPIPGSTPKRVFYTIKFHRKTNDVDVIRVGEEGKAGTVALSKIAFDLARIPDYVAHAKDVKTLTAWLKTRYPTIAPTGKDVPTLKAAAEAEIAAAAVKKDWFKANYGMEELDAASAKTRLQTVQLFDPPQVAHMKDFIPDERKLMERAFETLSDPLLALLKGVPLARQRVYIKKSGTKKKPKYTPEPKTAGNTASTTAGDRTVVLYDSWFMNEERLFMGGTGNVAPESIETPLHEFGHVVGAQAGIKDAFEKKFTASKAKFKTAPITWYAKSDPGKEFFAEAFALYHADPGWMKANLPDMYDWFEKLSTTGSPPAP